jgi:hypothetical protein
MWFWADESGKFYLEVRYAKKPLPIGDGKSAILCQSLEDLAEKIDQLKTMVRSGDLDQQIEACSASTILSVRDNHLGRFLADGVGVD